MTKKIDKKWAILAIFWLGLLAYVLLMKLTVSGMPKIQNLDKVGHFGLFFGQFWLIGRAIKGWQIKSYWLAGIVLGLFFAVGSELAQGFFTQYRAMEFWDAVADMAGVVVALWLVQWANHRHYLK